jgi:hypothetical protein
MVGKFLVLSSLSLAVAACATPLTDRRCDEIDRRSCNMPLPAGETLAGYRQADTTLRPTVGVPVAVSNVVVSAIDDYLERGGNTGDVWVQEVVDDPAFNGCAPMPDGRHVCGIQLFAPANIPTGSFLLVGDTVRVTGGTYDEFDCTPCCPPPRRACRFDGRTLPEFSRTGVERIGTGVEPVIVPATIQQIVEGADRYVGVLVRITGDVMLETPTGGDATRGEIRMVGGVNLTPQIGPLTDRTGRPVFDSATGRLNFTRLRNVTGIVSYFFGTKLMPRGPQDFEVVP